MFQLSAERVAALMNTDLESVMARTKKDGCVGRKRIDEASKVNEIFLQFQVVSYLYSIL